MASVSGSSVDGSVKPVSTAYRFDTLASPEQKKEALLSLAPSGLKTHRDNRAGEIVSDLQSRPTLSMPVPNGSGISAQVSAAQNQRGPSRDLQEAKIGCMLHPRSRGLIGIDISRGNGWGFKSI